MSRRHLTLAAALFVLAVAGCSDDDSETTTSPAPPDPVETPDGGDPPPSAAPQLPPEFVQCMAEQGVDVEQPSDIHSGPAQQALQACLPALHSGGGP